MEYVKFCYINGRYKYIEASDKEMEILGIFFASDVYVNDIYLYERFCLSDDRTETGGNATFIEKQGDKILIEDAYATEDDLSYFEVRQEQFLWLLHNWKQVYIRRPREIIITKSNNKFEINGAD